MKRTILYISGVLLAACGGSGSIPLSTAPGTGGGQVNLHITGAKSFNPSSTPGKIIQYTITISGDGFDPIVTTIDGNTTQTTITGVPVGHKRSVHVAAYNSNNQIIREGEAQNITVTSDAIATAPVIMQAVPVITNVADGAYVSNTRLRFSIFSDPATVVEVHSSHNGNTSVLADVVDNRPQVAIHAETGLALFRPGILSPGEYAVVVNDVATGRHSKTNITITDGKKERGAPLISGATTKSNVGVFGRTPNLWMTQVE